MNRSFFCSIVFFITMAFSLASCNIKEEIVPREYPRLDTETVTDINDSGATFTGSIKTQGLAPITEYGFVWSDKPYVYVDYSSKISMSASQVTKGSFSATATYAMQANKTHYVRAYARSGEYVVYGPLKSFESKGSLAPVISSFSPTTARTYDYVTIIGQNFTQDLNRLKVLFGNSQATITSATPDKIICMVPNNLQATQVKITVQVAGMSTESTDNFTLTK